MATFTRFGTRRTVRILLVGCGAMGQGWVERIIAKPGLSLIGLADIDPKAAEATVRRFQLDGGFSAGPAPGRRLRQRPQSGGQPSAGPADKCGRGRSEP